MSKVRLKIGLEELKVLAWKEPLEIGMVLDGTLACKTSKRALIPFDKFPLVKEK